ncbi:hypothetical protein ACFQ0O_27270 [Saccharopolyspora spinosporotrichia]
MVSAVEEANRRVDRFYGGRVSSPRIVACLTDGCYRRIGGGGERGVAVLNSAVMLSPRGVDPVIASHEMSHVELHTRLHSSGARVPQWFDEGLAVLVSGDPRHLAPATAPDRCLVPAAEPLPETLDGWLKAAAADPAPTPRRRAEWTAGSRPTADRPPFWTSSGASTRARTSTRSPACERLAGRRGEPVGRAAGR